MGIDRRTVALAARTLRWHRSRGLSALTGQEVHQSFRLSQFRLALDRLGLGRTGALSKSPQRREGLVVELAVGALRCLGRGTDLLGEGI